MGFITPIGNDVETVWSNLVEGVSGIGPITHFDTTGFDTKIAGEVKGFDPLNWLDKKDLKKCGRFPVFWRTFEWAFRPRMLVPGVANVDACLRKCNLDVMDGDPAVERGPCLARLW